MPPPATAEPPREGAARAVTWLVAAAFFMEILDGTIVATAMPAMGRAFAVPAVDLHLGMTAYLLTVALLVPVTGWAAERWGARRVFVAAIAVFSVASLLCGLSTGLYGFVAARILQGMGGAAMMPVGRLIVLRATPRDGLMAAIATIVWPALIAPVVAPPLGGFLVVHASWRWIFFLNLPLGLAALACAVVLIPADAQGARRPLDLVGFLACGLALTAIVAGSDALARPGAGHGGWLAIGLGLAAGAVAVRHLRRHPAPLFDLDVLRVPTYAVGVWGGSLMRIAIGTAPFLLPLMFQLSFRLDAFRSGLLTLPVFAGNLAMKTATSAVLRRLGFRTVLLGNGLLVAVSLAACALLTPATPAPLVVALLFAGGAFRSMQFTALSTIQFADVPAERTGAANTLAAMLSQLTLGIGVVVGAGALALAALARGGDATAPTLADFHAGFIAIGLLALCALPDFRRLPGDAAAHVSGHRRRE